MPARLAPPGGANKNATYKEYNMNTLAKIASMTRKEFESSLDYSRNADFSDSDTQRAKYRFLTMAFLTKKEALAVWREQRADAKLS